MVLAGHISTEYGRVSYESTSDKLGEYIHIYDLYVKKENRRLGYGKELLNRAITDIRDTGYNGDIMIVAIPAEDSIPITNLKSFYKSLGLVVYDAYVEVK